jgi:hypothetical protein
MEKRGPTPRVSSAGEGNELVEVITLLDKPSYSYSYFLCFLFSALRVAVLAERDVDEISSLPG